MISKRIELLNEQYKEKKIIRDRVYKEVNDLSNQIQEYNDSVKKINETSILLSKLSLESKEVVVRFLEKMVTDALRYISEGEYAFKIEFENTEKTTKCEFYIVETIDGIESKQRPQDACGGGFIDIISTTLRYAFINLCTVPKNKATVILDEPGKMVSADMSIKFAEFIKKMGTVIKRQTIMITHNNNLMNIADKTISVRKGV